MGSYIPSTADERKKMLETVGVKDCDALFAAIPPQMRVDKLDLPAGKNEMEVSVVMADLAAKNTVFRHIFRGAGAYNHYIPALVDSVSAKEQFLTAYTPYQAEISQGVLQSIFEYQTMICMLTGMDVSNASVYDGASAAAEAVAMCVDKKRTKALLSGALHPMVIETVKTYGFGSGTEVVVIPVRDGATDLDALAAALDGTSACVVAPQPGYFGRIEDCEKIAELAHAAGAKFVMSVHPIAAALLKPPGECGADVAVGEGQPLGLPLSFGGPWLGFMAATQAMMRRLPGRIVGQTADHDGRRGFVLTLQAREQHIRREKASSNICSNQALCALRAGVYMASMGANGLRQAAVLCAAKAHYLAAELAKIPGFERAHRGEFFQEFVTGCPVDPGILMDALARRGILGGLPLPDGGILWCCTEQNTRADIDMLVAAVKEVCGA